MVRLKQLKSPNIIHIFTELYYGSSEIDKAYIVTKKVPYDVIQIGKKVTKKVT